MSWNMYVTELLHSKQATKAAIYGLDGTRYAGSDGLNLTKEQIDEIIDWVSENGFDGVSNEERNILIDNTHYIVTDCQDGVLSGVYQRSGFTAAKTNKGPNHDQVQHMAETLKKKGY
ncbi:hypothetical protein ABK040_001222 [Willaertia magna]